jgi:DNA-binding LacI/PurR family transcriptional regulator
VLAAGHLNPPLSTIDIPPSELGKHAAAALTARIDNPRLKRQLFRGTARLLPRQAG